jgi:hypothetical protein
MWCTDSLTSNNCTRCPHCIYVFCIRLRTNGDFRLLACSILSMSTFGWFSSVWFILADVSEPSVRSIFKGLMYEVWMVRGERGIYIYRVWVCSRWQGQWGREASGVQIHWKKIRTQRNTHNNLTATRLAPLYLPFHTYPSTLNRPIPDASLPHWPCHLEQTRTRYI